MQNVTTQCRTAALLDRRHDFELSEAQMPLLRFTPGGPVSAEDVRDLQGGTPHGGDLRRRQVLQRTDHLAQ